MYILRALHRARFAVLSIFATYLLSCLVGIAMVHAHNSFALSRRDKLVGTVQQSKTLTALNAGFPLRAAALDFAGNLFAGFSSSLSGLCAPLPYPTAAYRGWIGGIVSVDGEPRSRFSTRGSAIYYVVVLLLQIVPYSIAGGAGVNAGISLFRPAPYYLGPKVWVIPKEALRDVGRLYLLIVPLFFFASLVEFYFA